MSETPPVAAEEPPAEPAAQVLQEMSAALRPPRPLLLVERTATVRVSRASVLLRLLLAVPHVVVLYAVGVAAEVVAVVGWFAALALGRLPRWASRFLAWVVRYGARVNAYLYLLTDRWPTFGGSPYPVLVRLAPPGRLNRAAVLFRLLLVIPAGLLGLLLGYGTLLGAPFAWLVVLATGRVPRPLFDALASSVRFHTRYSAYLTMLTPAYPAGLFGDDADPRQEPAASQADGVGPAPGDVVPAPARPPVMARPARVAVGVLVGLGVLVVAGAAGYTAVSARSTADRSRADRQLYAAYQRLSFTSPSACEARVDVLSCLRTAADRNEAVVRRFGTDLDAIELPADVHAQAAALHSATAVLASDFHALGRAGSLSAYNEIAATEGIGDHGRRFDEIVRALGAALEQR